MSRKVVLGLSLISLLLPDRATAQDGDLPFLLSDPPSADSEWYSGYDGSWDPSFDRAWSRSSSPWQLGFVAGMKTNVAAGAATWSRRSGRDYYAMATLQFPLQDLRLTSRDSRLAVQSVSPSRPSEDDGSVRAPIRASQPGGRGEAGTTSTESPAQDDARGDKASSDPDSKVIEKNSSRRSSEPRQLNEQNRHGEVVLEKTKLVRALLSRVQAASDADLSRAELDSLKKRSRLSGLVPELRLRGVYGFDETVSREDGVGLYPGDSTTRGGRDSLVEARLTFRLDRLIYGDRESTFYRERHDLKKEERQQSQEALALLIDWISAKRKSSDPRLLHDELLRAIADEEEALLSLYVLTGGWFQGEHTLIQLRLERLLEELNESSGTPATELDDTKSDQRSSLGSSELRPLATLPVAEDAGSMAQRHQERRRRRAAAQPNSVQSAPK